MGGQGGGAGNILQTMLGGMGGGAQQPAAPAMQPQGTQQGGKPMMGAPQGPGGMGGGKPGMSAPQGPAGLGGLPGASQGPNRTAMTRSLGNTTGLGGKPAMGAAQGPMPNPAPAPMIQRSAIAAPRPFARG